MRTNAMAVFMRSIKIMSLSKIGSNLAIATAFELISASASPDYPSERCKAYKIVRRTRLERELARCDERRSHLREGNKVGRAK